MMAGAKLYLIVWGWLAGLMLLGVFVSERPILPWSRAAIVVLILGLSSIKAALVALYYMHLKGDRPLLALLALAPFVLILLAVGVVFSSAFVRL